LETISSLELVVTNDLPSAKTKRAGDEGQHAQHNTIGCGSGNSLTTPAARQGDKTAARRQQARQARAYDWTGCVVNCCANGSRITTDAIPVGIRPTNVSCKPDGAIACRWNKLACVRRCEDKIE